MRRPAVLLLALALVLASAAWRPLDVGPTPQELGAVVSRLAAADMEGRASGTAGGERAARELARELEAAGLRPAGDRGTFFQSFVISTEPELAPGNTLALTTEDRDVVAATSASPLRLDLDRDGDRRAPRVVPPGARSAGGVAAIAGPALHLDVDWRPHGGSPDADVQGRLAFVGYGVDSDDARWSDYSGVEVTGKIAVALDGTPRGWSGTATRLEKLVAARRHGARALLVVSDDLPSLRSTAATIRLPSAAITRAAADLLLARTGQTVAMLERTLERGTAASFVLPVGASVRIAIEHRAQRGENVVGVLPGRDPDLAHEAVVVGAHYDHVGIVNGEIHPGADDNASGTAVVVGLARAFAAMPASRSLVFALFGAEELGLLGSRHYVRAPVVPLERTVAMVNLDMVGRLRERRLVVAGVDSGRGLRDVATDVVRFAGVPADIVGDASAPSDHLTFHRAGVPVLFFSTGAHRDYHKPSDVADGIDADGLARIARAAAGAVGRLADGHRPAYVASPPAPDRAGGRAFLGVVADLRAGHGVRVSGVMARSAAERAGIREGDVLVRVAGRSMDGFDTLQREVRGRNPGDVVDLVYVRDGEARNTRAALGARP